MAKGYKKAEWLRLYNRVLSGILALLGFAPCTDEDEVGGIVPMYGMPSSIYKTKAKTTAMALDNTVVSGKKSVYVLDTDKKEKHAV